MVYRKQNAPIHLATRVDDFEFASQTASIEEIKSPWLVSPLPPTFFPYNSNITYSYVFFQMSYIYSQPNPTVLNDRTSHFLFKHTVNQKGHIKEKHSALYDTYHFIFREDSEKMKLKEPKVCK